MSDKDIKALILMIKKRYSYLNSHEKKNFDRILRITPTT